MANVTILHHAGDANDPPVRVAATIRCAMRYPRAMVVLGLKCAESEKLVRASGLGGRVSALSKASDTLTETTGTLDLVLRMRTDLLIVSTEPGHIGRALLIARIVYWRRGVRVQPWGSDPGTYRSPLRRTCIDAVRALIFRLTGRVVML